MKVSEQGFAPLEMKHHRKKSLTGFTYIEMLVVITLMALCFVPLLQMFTESMTQVGQYSELGTALQLGREAMEGVKNLRLTEAQIEAQGVVWFPPEKEPPLEMNHETWRVKRTPIKNSDPLEIHVEVFRSKDTKNPLVHFVTMIEDL